MRNSIAKGLITLTVGVTIGLIGSAALAQKMGTGNGSQQNDKSHDAFIGVANWKGTVIGEDGMPLVDATIRLTRTDIKGVFNTKTNKKGQYTYANLPTGIYNVAVMVNGVVLREKTGLIPHQEMAVGDLNNLPPNPPVDFDLSHKESMAEITTTTDTSAMDAKAKAEYDKQIKELAEKNAEIDAKNKELRDFLSTGLDAKTAKNWDLAIDIFTKASTKAPAQHSFWNQLGESYLKRSDTKNGDEKQADLDKAVVALQKAIEIKDSNAVYHQDLGMTYAHQGKFKEAKVEVARAAQLDPNQAGMFYYNLGVTAVNSGQSDQAEEALKFSIAVKPENADPHYQYGLLLMAKATLVEGKMVAPGAADEFQKYLQLAPSGADADGAKGMLDALGAKVDTTFSRAPDPNAKKQPAAKGTKK